MNEGRIIDLNDKKLILEELLYVDSYYTFSVKVKSGEFAGKSSFCIPEKSINNLTTGFKMMYEELEGQIVINDFDSDAFISFQMKKLGHIVISGQVGGSHQKQYLKFELESDQTILDKMIRYFNQKIK